MKFRDAWIVSLLAMLAGWAIGVVCMGIPYANDLFFHPGVQHFDWIAVLVIVLFPLPVLLPTWLLVLWPFAWFIPAGSILWKKSVLTGIGLLAGLLILVLESLLEFKLGLYHGDHSTQPWGPLLSRDLHNWGLTSAIVGATSGLVESLVQSRLNRSTPAIARYQRADL
jgi:hypothetical protein